MDRRSIKITPGRGLGNRLLSIAISQAIEYFDHVRFNKIFKGVVKINEL